MMCDKIIINSYISPSGELMLGSRGDELCLCDWENSGHPHTRERVKRCLGADYESGSSPVIDMARIQLDEYFAGEREAFDIPALLVGSEFQKSVWRRLLTLPYGSTTSYGQIARDIGAERAVRAVANAVAANALSIFVPCHRVTGHKKALTGYAGGLAAKEYLLKLEHAL